MDEKFYLNGVEITREELLEKQKEIEGKKNTQLVEVSKNNFKIRILG